MKNNFFKNQRKHANKKIKKHEYIIAICGSLDKYHQEICFLSAYGLEARPTFLPDDLIPNKIRYA